MALRMHERGWRCFAPRRVVVYHQWSRAGRPSFREVHHPHRAVLERLSVGVVRKALGMLPGGNRTVSTRVAAYQRTCGVDFANETVSEFARNGGRAANAFVSATANAGQQLALAIFHKSSHAAVSEAQVQRPAQNVNAGDVVNDDGSGAGMMAELKQAGTAHSGDMSLSLRRDHEHEMTGNDDDDSSDDKSWSVDDLD